jgi:hypothetical protein
MAPIFNSSNSRIIPDKTGEKKVKFSHQNLESLKLKFTNMLNALFPITYFNFNLEFVSDNKSLLFYLCVSFGFLLIFEERENVEFDGFLLLTW